MLREERRRRNRTTPLRKGLTWERSPYTLSQRPTVHTVKLPGMQSGKHTNYYTHTRTITAALKIKTNQCLMQQILGVREEWSGRIERERED